jgi:hypothetical protein
MGLVFAVTSYDGRIIISPTSCREQIPDPEFFALCIREVFQEYLEIADRAAAAPRKPRARGTSKVGKPTKGKGEGKAPPRRRKAA